MKLFKIFLPKENAQQVTELESFTVKWKVHKQGYREYNINFKVFIKENEAKEFKKQLIESANFIGCWIDTEMYKN